MNVQTEELDVNLDMEIILSEEDKSVYVKLTGFESIEDADTYAHYLTSHLPLMLFHSEILH
jgi:hypothetical protein